MPKRRPAALNVLQWGSMNTLPTYTLASISKQVDKIREEVRTKGQFVAGCEELAILCSDRISEEDRRTGLEQIAEWEGWIVNTLADGRVRFSGLRSR